MIQPLFVTGEAGAGKTRTLMEQAAICGARLIKKPHQCALAMVVMHGARRQLQLTLRSYCPDLPVAVSTIHSFALKIVNRWRRCLGLALPLTICESSCQFVERYGRTQATFDEIVRLACSLLESATVRATLAESHPLVIVDEFQDCIGSTLNFVKALATSHKLLLAADHFQLLTDETEGCPAVEWVQQLQNQNAVEYVELAGCRRTEVSAILDAARALRDDTESTQPTVPVYHGHRPEQVAYRIVERFIGWGAAKPISGSCALIALSMDDVLLDQLLTSFKRQLERRSARRVNWIHTVPEGRMQLDLLEELGIGGGSVNQSDWSHSANLSGHASAVAEDVIRFTRLNGISPIPEEVVRQFVKQVAHNARAFARSTPRYQVLTVHAAKNREFDHVFVFWGYKNSGWAVEQQRKLLYNAVTRARVDCTVLVLGGAKRIQSDAAVKLLGPSQPAIDPRWKKKRSARVSRRAQRSNE